MIGYDNGDQISAFLLLSSHSGRKFIDGRLHPSRQGVMGFGNGDRQDGNRDGKSRLFEDGHAERPSATTICEATKIPIPALASKMILTAT
jgi:hypothetical protein